MYLSPAVRTMRDDPTDGADATLAVRLDDEEAVDAAREAVTESGGAVEDVTRFDAVRASVPEPSVANLLDGLPAGTDAVETVTTVADEQGSEE